ncbi:MAG: endonuclease [Erysipelotrichaceae bacterium]|jgi:endonuclease I|nr:endonuclease [Erysipelotrichaceae bacterium]
MKKVNLLIATFALLSLIAVKGNPQPLETVAETSPVSYAYTGTYYGDINFSDGLDASEKSALLALISLDDPNSYSSGFWTSCEESAEDPNNPSNVILIYNSVSVSKTNHSLWNKEHVWPQSKMNDTIGGDLHNLFPCNPSINSSRSNRSYIQGSGDYTTVGSNNFFPGDEWRGEVARTCMYMAFRYNMTLGNVIPTALALEWNEIDPVSEWELRKNDIIYTKFSSRQNNRNPFIDHPEIAADIFGSNTTVPNPTALTISGSDLVSVNGTTKLSVTSTPANANKSVTWTSSNNSVATVSTTGVVTGVTEGQVTITATSTVATNVSATISIKVGTPVVPTDKTHLKVDSFPALSFAFGTTFNSNGLVASVVDKNESILAANVNPLVIIKPASTFSLGYQAVFFSYMYGDEEVLGSYQVFVTTYQADPNNFTTEQISDAFVKLLAANDLTITENYTMVMAEYSNLPEDAKKHISDNQDGKYKEDMAAYQTLVNEATITPFMNLSYVNNTLIIILSIVGAVIVVGAVLVTLFTIRKRKKAV